MDNSSESPNVPSPPRENIENVNDPNQAINPELTTNQRTLELACDQSIAARSLLYYPGPAAQEVILRCAAGVNSILDIIKPPNESGFELKNAEIFVSMCTRLMADGGAGRIAGFNADLQLLSDIKTDPELYRSEVIRIAEKCETKMRLILASCQDAGPGGAVARQALLNFMGDLGGLELENTGFGKAYANPLSTPQEIYDTFAKGLFVAQQRLLLHSSDLYEPNQEQLELFKKSLDEARRLTTKKPDGVLSATVHTITKATERQAQNWTAQERHGLLNQGDLADDKIFGTDRSSLMDSEQKLLSVGWPVYVVPVALVQDVVEPVTGHVSGSFGEIAVMISMFCGTSLESITLKEPYGNLNKLPSINVIGMDDMSSEVTSTDETSTEASSTDEKRISSHTVGSLAAALLIAAGYHSAVEIFQPMSTFCGQALHPLLGVLGVENTRRYAEQLRAFASWREANPNTDENLYEAITAMDKDDKKLTIEKLKTKAKSCLDVITKEQDMISLSQGRGSTLATIEMCAALADETINPMLTRARLSPTTREELFAVSGLMFDKAVEVSRLLEPLCINDRISELRQEALLLCEDRVVDPNKKMANARDRVDHDEALKLIVQEALEFIHNLSVDQQEKFASEVATVEQANAIELSEGGDRRVVGGGVRINKNAAESRLNLIMTNLARIVGLEERTFKDRYIRIVRSSSDNDYENNENFDSKNTPKKT